MYNIWDFGVTNIYFQIFHNLSLRLDIGPILQMRKTRLREVRVHNAHQSMKVSTEAWNVIPLEFKSRLA